MKTLAMLAVMIIATVSVATAQEGKTTIRGGKPFFEASEVVTEHAIVLAIDKTTRGLTLRAEAGDTLIVTVKPDVKTFGQIKVGDSIKITYTERFTIHIESSGSAELTHESMRADAKEGEQPRATLTERTSYKATIAAIDTVKKTVTLKDASGEAFTVTPRHPENLSLVSVGDLVVFTSTQTVAAAIEKEAPKKAAPKKQ